jgi:hypothetical protein
MEILEQEKLFSFNLSPGQHATLFNGQIRSNEHCINTPSWQNWSFEEAVGCRST